MHFITRNARNPTKIDKSIVKIGAILVFEILRLKFEILGLNLQKIAESAVFR